MKKILLLAIISIFAIILSACGPKVGKTNREEIKPSGDVERIEVTEEEITTIPVVDFSKLSVKHDVDYRMGTILLKLANLVVELHFAFIVEMSMVLMVMIFI